jgi:hypothetical protein
MTAQAAALAVVGGRLSRCTLGYTVPAVVEYSAYDLSCAKVMCLVREPDAGDRPVRFDEEDVETE